MAEVRCTARCGSCPACELCRHYQPRHRAVANGHDVGDSDGWCARHGIPVNLGNSCDRFHCIHAEE